MEENAVPVFYGWWVYDLSLVNSGVSAGFSKIVFANIKPGNHNRWAGIEYECGFTHY